MSSKVATVIPTYKDELNPLEKISLAQCRKVLGKYPLIFVAPEGKNFSYFEPCDGIVYFPPQFFQSTKTYNQLMMSPGFYKPFSDYEYILIYQLDAFVFYDALEIFCSLGWDYIGAPWPKMYRRHWSKIISRVGNGGFSLRKVAAYHKLLEKHPDWIHQWLAKNWPEDVFFSYCGKRDDCDFRVAPVDAAYKFAAEFNPVRSVKKLGGKFPFGCHGWHDHNPEFYVNIFRNLGYDLRPLKNFLKFSDGGLTNWLLKTAIIRLARRVQRGRSLLRYLPTNRFASVCVIRRPFAMKIFMQLLTDDSSLADKIFICDPDEQDILLHELTPRKLPHLLITAGGADENLTAAAENKGLAYGKRVVSFQREYLKRCEKLLRKLGKSAP